MATPFVLPLFQAVDALGTPLNGGKLYTYKSNTTLPEDTYQDAEGTVANPNPVVLNARGEAIIYLPSDRLYTFELRDSSGTAVIWSIDGVSGITSSVEFGQFKSDLLGVSGSDVVGFDWSHLYQSGRVGWGTRTSETYVSVLRYIPEAQWAAIAAGTSTVDLAPYIQPAVDLNVPLFFPVGTYTIRSTLLVKGNGMGFYGAGRGRTQIIGNGCGVIANAGTANRTHITIQGLNLEMRGTTNGKVVDHAYFSYSYYAFNTLSARDCVDPSGFCGVGNVGGSGPYYNVFIQNYLGAVGTTGTASTKSVAYNWEATDTGSIIRGPNNNVAIGGRVSSWDCGAHIAGDQNAMQSVAFESIRPGGYATRVGMAAPRSTGTATGGTISTISSDGLFTGVQANGGVKIISGMGAGQARKVSAGNVNTISVYYNWGVIPDSTSVFEWYPLSSIANVFSGIRHEGSAGSTIARSELGNAGAKWDWTYFTGVNPYESDAFNKGDQIIGPGEPGDFVPYIFTLNSLAAGMASVAATVGGSAAVSIPLYQNGSIVGVELLNSSTLSAGEITATATVNGVATAATGRLWAGGASLLNASMNNPRAVNIGATASPRRIGVSVSTSGDYAASTGNLTVVLLIKHHN